jgi:hypothetical protein
MPRDHEPADGDFVPFLPFSPQSAHLHPHRALACLRRGTLLPLLPRFAHPHPRHTLARTPPGTYHVFTFFTYRFREGGIGVRSLALPADFAPLYLCSCGSRTPHLTLRSLALRGAGFQPAEGRVVRPSSLLCRPGPSGGGRSKIRLRRVGNLPHGVPHSGRDIPEWPALYSPDGSIGWEIGQ